MSALFSKLTTDPTWRISGDDRGHISPMSRDLCPPFQTTGGDDNPRMIENGIQARIRELLDERGMTAEAASRKAGLDKTYLRKLFERPNASPGTKALASLADALGTTVGYLVNGKDAPEAMAIRGEARAASVPLPPIATLPNDLPVRGTAAGSHLGGAFQFEGGIVDYVRRPPALLGAMNAYGLFIEGTSMVPEHNPGDLRFVHPDRPPRIGDSVIVQVRNGPNHEPEAMIGHLLRRTETTVFLGKLNPEATVQLKRETVISIHKVLTVNELFGV